MGPIGALDDGRSPFFAKREGEKPLPWLRRKQKAELSLIVRNFLPKSRRLLFGGPDGTREKTALWLAVSCSRELFVVE
jgi:hypothetical protein